MDARIKPVLTWGALGAALLISLPIDTLPLAGIVDIRILPLSSALASIFIFFALKRINISPLLKAVFAFLVFVLIQGALSLFYDIAIGSDGIGRVFVLGKQLFALLSGIAVFFVLRKALIIKPVILEKFVLIGGSIGLAVGLLNFLWGFTGNELVGTIVTLIRESIAPQGWNAPMRASGISFEPSHFAIFLATVFLPLLIVYYKKTQNRLVTLAIVVAFIVSFIWTFSTAGLIAIVFFLSLGVVLGPNRRAFALPIALLLLGLIFMVTVFPDNYMLRQVGILAAESKTGSFGDRFYSTVGPFMMIKENSRILLGYGLGGVAIHFTEIIPPEVQHYMLAVHPPGSQMSLATLIGRLIAETGALGLLLFLVFVLVAIWEQRRAVASAPSETDRLMLGLARNSLLTFVFTSSFAMGSFSFPYLWFWLAVIDSMYVRFLTQEEGSAPAVASAGRITDRPATNLESKQAKKRYAIKIFSYKFVFKKA